MRYRFAMGGITVRQLVSAKGHVAISKKKGRDLN
jgi:hypothetical protein